MNQAVRTKTDLIEIFGKLGVSSGTHVMVHSSMKSLGYVVNGALDVIDSLIELVGKKGTILMPSHSGQLTDPMNWKVGNFSESEKDIIRQSMQPFDPKLTQIRNRGEIPRVFLTYPKVHRSFHPISSVAAKGKLARYLTSIHDLNESEGENSPVGRLYDLDGHILLIGVDLSSCSAIHLAEYKADVHYLANSKMRVLVKNTIGKPEFVDLMRYPGDSSRFIRVRSELGEDIFRTIKLNTCTITFFKIRPVIDYVFSKLLQNPNYLRNDS